MGCKSQDKPKPKHRKGLWSPEEDLRLRNFVLKHGHGCWSSVPIKAEWLSIDQINNNNNISHNGPNSANIMVQPMVPRENFGHSLSFQDGMGHGVLLNEGIFGGCGDQFSNGVSDSDLLHSEFKFDEDEISGNGFGHDLICGSTDDVCLNIHDDFSMHSDGIYSFN
uniref:Uncharacterized protein n=1 Tax=Cannabis sativa TaxID=3483 RepID=A0A803PQL9_CANSA